MSVRDHVSSAVAAPRIAGWWGRATALVAAQPLAVGVLFLILCGWKFTLGLNRTLDIDPHHEAMYLGYMLGIYPGGTPPEYSPIYVWLYALEHRLLPSIIDVFYVNMALLTVALPIAAFVFLTVKRVPFAVAVPSALYLMIAAANLPVRPKPMHLALVVLLLGLAAFVQWRHRPERWGFLLVIWAALTLIRPELLYAVILVGLYCAYKTVTERRAWIGIVAALPVVAALYWAMGLPLFGERSMLALAFHFGANYSSWHQTGDVPFTEDFETIFAHVFGQPHSIPGAFLANPGAFLHSMATNLIHVPKALAGMWLAHFNVLLPRYLICTMIEAAVVGLVAIGGLVWAWRNWHPQWPQGGIVGGTLAGARRVLVETPETVCLLLFLIPYAAMMVIIYPRFHYALAVGLMAALLGLTIFAAKREKPRLSIANLVMLPILLAMVPSLGSVGARLDDRLGAVSAQPLTTLAEARFLQQLRPQGIVHVFESTDPGVSPYAGPLFRSNSEMDKPQGLAAYFATHDFSVVIEDKRLRDFARYSDDPEWAAFRKAPEAFGFGAHKLPGTDAVVYVKSSLWATAATGEPR
jgi:hypothetical protein